MFKKIVTISALALALAGCDTCGDKEGPCDGYAGQFAPGSYEDFKQNVGDRVFFAFNSSNLSHEARSTIARQAEWMNKYNCPSATVEGHTDERGTSEYNLALGERRASSDRNELVRQGVDSSRVSTVSFGKERPAAEGHNEAAWAQNRRAVTVIN